MKIESVMWLLLVFFMIHDFEEIVFAKKWVEENSDYLKNRLAGLPARLIYHIEELPVTAFALAVAEEFVLLALIVLLCVQYGWYSLFAAVLLAYLLHVLLHFAQGVFLSRAIPVLSTCIISAIYCIWALWVLSSRSLLDWIYIAEASPIVFFLLIANLIFAHYMAKRIVTG